MENILFAFLALILLIPLLYFLPLGFKKQGKLIIVGISLLLALFGLLANTVFNLWQTSLLLLVFALAATYLIEKRLSTLIFADKGSSRLEEEVEVSNDHVVSSSEEETEGIINEEKEVEAEKFSATSETLLLKDANEDHQEDSLSLELDEIEYFSTDPKDGIDDDTIGKVSEKELDEEWFVEKTQSDDLKDQTLVHNEETTTETEEVKAEQNDADDASIVDYNIDEIINEAEANTVENELAHTVDNTEETISFDTLEELDFMEEDLLTEDEIRLVEEDEYTIEEDKHQVDEEDIIDEKDLLVEDVATVIEEETEVVEHDLIEEEVKVLEEDLVEEDEVQEEKGVEEEIEVIEEQQFEEESEVVDEELVEEELEIGITEESVKTKQVKQQMIHTMVAQLQHSRKYLSSKEYVNQVQAHLHPSLPSVDYYTFAHLLIEHFISEHNDKELASLITHLKEKFTNYAIIQQQLQFLEEYYCKK
ncbi:hypothetical protein IMZ08_08835 [Bacillus luteolus]|uniref:MFS transporter n=1 Tax=Litchfieldia luteola TaxID=682179 RepID=A0ABR9QI35_9BACI|nr:hypothetical protein [Cytobacillus luteolus]MBE4908158.1 hypothetical protein [Cytobacillus luteolus]MBP1942943.1 hypothetical protein [Cytobacillus luteolus]